MICQTKTSQQAFTLIEVMVALAILAVIAISASRASMSYLKSIDTLKTRTTAHFIAQNIANELYAKPTWITQTKIQTIQAEGQNWQATLTPSDTPSPNLKIITIKVAPMIDNQAQKNTAQITLVITNPNPTKIAIDTQ